MSAVAVRVTATSSVPLAIACVIGLPLSVVGYFFLKTREVAR